MQKLIDTQLSTSSIPVSFAEGFFILLASVLAGLIIRYFFYRFGDSMSSRRAFGNTILLVTVSVASLIAVVKSSLALSLGLVGALSVVRFRTAVKEPYNLSFILLSICIGIAIGASQFVFSILICIFGCLITFLLSRYKEKSNDRGNVDDLDSISLTLPSSVKIENLYRILEKNSLSYNIKTFSDSKEGFINLTLRASISNLNKLENIRKEIKETFDDVDFAFYETPSN